MRVWVWLLLGVAFAALGLWAYYKAQMTRLYPEASREVVQLTPEKRSRLQHLLEEHKFQPHNYPPLGYTGAASAEDEQTASTTVNRVIEFVLEHADQPIAAKAVAARFSQAMRGLAMLETEDRDRAQGYLLEIWYIVGFKGATGRFAYGSAYQKPEGYGEPLPPGWTAPDHPRPIG